jgi:hypothetical protein
MATTYMVSLNPDQVLQNLKGDHIQGATVQLPTRYLFGVSGECWINQSRTLTIHIRVGVCRDWNDYYEDNEPKICTSKFPQQFNLLSVVQADIQDQNSSQYQVFTQVLSTYKIITDQNTWNSFTQAAAALLVLSIIWAFATIAIMLAVPRKSYPRYITIISLLDAVLMLTAAALWTSAINQAASDYQASGEFNPYGTINLGPGFWLLWVVCIAKLCIMPAIALILFILTPSIFCIACFLNCCSDEHEREGDKFCCEAICFLCDKD